MIKDIIKEKWIEPRVEMVVYPMSIIEMRRYIKEWAKELGWEVHEDKELGVDERGERGYFFEMKPRGKKISPLEFEKIKDKIYGFLNKLVLLDNLPVGDEKKYVVIDTLVGFLNIITVEKKEEVRFFTRYGDYFIIEYKLKDRLRLEEKDMNLAKSIFRETTVKEDLGSIDLETGLFGNWFNKEDTKKKNEVKKKIKEFFGITWKKN